MKGRRRRRTGETIARQLKENHYCVAWRKKRKNIAMQQKKKKTFLLRSERLHKIWNERWLGKTLLCERPRSRSRKKLVGPFIKLPLKCILREFVYQISGVLQRITSALDWQGWYGQWQKKILGENSCQILAGEQCWGQTTKTLCKLWKQKVNRAFNGCYIHPSESGAKAHSGVSQSKIPKLDLVFNVMIKDSNILNVTLNLADSSTFSHWTECSHPRGKRRAADKSKKWIPMMIQKKKLRARTDVMCQSCC